MIINIYEKNKLILDFHVSYKINNIIKTKLIK